MNPETHCCGPEHDTDFFKAIGDVMRKYPQLAKKYMIVCVDHETDIMKIDFDKQGAVSRIEGKTVITEFKDLEDIKRMRVNECCGWRGTAADGSPICAKWWYVQ